MSHIVTLLISDLVYKQSWYRHMLLKQQVQQNKLETKADNCKTIVVAI